MDKVKVQIFFTVFSIKIKKETRIFKSFGHIKNIFYTDMKESFEDHENFPVGMLEK